MARQPKKLVTYVRTITADNRSVRFNTIKSLWRKACFARREVILGDGSVKRNWFPKDTHVSLKEFARQALNGAHGDEAKRAASDWRHNKTANTSKPPLGIGRTNHVKKSGDKK